jgi:XapX domain-containing protein
MVKPVIGIVLGLLIGVGCRSFGIPLPGPPAIFGAILAVAMATGYTMTDRILTRRVTASTVRDGEARDVTQAPGRASTR